MSKSSVLIFNGGSVGGDGSCDVHNIQLGIMTVNLPGFHTSSMYVLLDRSLPIESAPGYAPVDRYALAEWIRRGDVIQVDCADISPETDTSYTGILQSTTAVNQQGELYTNTCTIRLDVKAENHTESRYYHLEIVHDILTDVWYLAQDVNEYTYILNENAENKVQTIDNNSEHYPSCPAVKEAIDTAVASVYHAAGPKTVSQLTSSLLVAANQGNVYNMTDSGTTTADFIEGAGRPIRAGDNVGICDVGGGVYKFDLLSGFVDLTGYLAANGDGSDVTASFTTTSTRANITTGEKLSVLFGKIAKWFADLKALAFKDKVNTADIENDAVTADKVKDGETLPANVTGSAKSLSSSLCSYGSSGSKYRLVAKSAPLGNTVNVHFECKFSASNYNSFQSATLQFNAVYSESTNSIVFSNGKVINDHGSSNLWKFYLVPNIAEKKVEIYAESTGSNFNSLNLIALFANGESQNYVNGTTYFHTVVNSVPTPNVVVPVRTAVSTETGVGNATTPVYIDNNGVPQPCENRIHDLTLQRKNIRTNGEIHSRNILCDRQSWTGTAEQPEFTPISPNDLCTWLNRGDVVNIDFTTYDWWRDKYPGLIVEAQCDALAGETTGTCTNLRVLRQKIVNNQTTIDFAWSNLITDEDTNTKYMEFHSI